ncbi:hypothetical protein NHJ6243_000189 [Beauveria neobassiana]
MVLGLLNMGITIIAEDDDDNVLIGVRPDTLSQGRLAVVESSSAAYIVLTVKGVIMYAAQNLKKTKQNAQIAMFL